MIGHTGYITFARKLDPTLPKVLEKKESTKEFYPMPEF
jgi:hypothetical protein